MMLFLLFNNLDWLQEAPPDFRACRVRGLSISDLPSWIRADR